jgi:hypothetical protein
MQRPRCSIWPASYFHLHLCAMWYCELADVTDRPLYGTAADMYEQWVGLLSRTVQDCGHAAIRNKDHVHHVTYRKLVYRTKVRGGRVVACENTGGCCVANVLRWGSGKCDESNPYSALDGCGMPPWQAIRVSLATFTRRPHTFTCPVTQPRPGHSHASLDMPCARTISSRTAS